jgi:RNA polymerase sigma-70 factor (ECF subfamily)
MTCTTIDHSFDLKDRLSEIYREHYDFVWRSVRRLGLPDGAIDDAVQDVFMVAYRRLADFEGRSTIRTWLFGIALRVVKDHRRKAMRADRRVKALSAPEPGPSLDETVARKRAVKLLDAILAELDDAQRAVFVMAEIEGMTAPEISAALDVKLNTVYSRLRLGRKKFQRALARYREQVPVLVPVAA